MQELVELGRIGQVLGGLTVLVENLHLTLKQGNPQKLNFAST
jgi:hypothetical protein